MGTFSSYKPTDRGQEWLASKMTNKQASALPNRNMQDIRSYNPASAGDAREVAGPGLRRYDQTRVKSRDRTAIGGRSADVMPGHNRQVFNRTAPQRPTIPSGRQSHQRSLSAFEQKRREKTYMNAVRDVAFRNLRGSKRAAAMSLASARYETPIAPGSVNRPVATPAIRLLQEAAGMRSPNRKSARKALIAGAAKLSGREGLAEDIVFGGRGGYGSSHRGRDREMFEGLVGEDVEEMQDEGGSTGLRDPVAIMRQAQENAQQNPLNQFYGGTPGNPDDSSDFLGEETLDLRGGAEPHLDYSEANDYKLGDEDDQNYLRRYE